jgi:hypothetical protein
MADNQGSLDSLTTNGAETDYSLGASSGFGAYVGKLSQHTDIDIRGDSAGGSELTTDDITNIQGNNRFEYVFVSVGEACLSGTSGGGTSTDASVYALLSNGTVYCASM